MAPFPKKLQMFGLFDANVCDCSKENPHVTQTLTLKPLIELAQARILYFTVT